jgi:hypothetical protein
LLGGTLVFFLKYRDNFGGQGRAILQNMVVVLVLNLLIGLRLRLHRQLGTHRWVARRDADHGRHHAALIARRQSCGSAPNR